MCGIYGAICHSSVQNSDGAVKNKQHHIKNPASAHAAELVHRGLKQLEYRGYDSWGVAVSKDGELYLQKQTGKIGMSQPLQLPAATAAIGHTRWATHGGVTQVNAHPHLAHNGSFALVQNGVMENYQTIKQTITKSGYKFISQTDTEVIVALIESEMTIAGESEPSLETIQRSFQQLAGRNTIAVLTRSGTLYAIRNGSPLVVGRGSGWFISSDVLSLVNDATEYLMLENGQGVMIQPSSNSQIQPSELLLPELLLFDISKKTSDAFASENQLIQPHFQPITISATKLDRDGYDHFMLKEIFEQTDVLLQVLQQPQDQLAELVAALQQANHVYVVGAGSASYAAQVIARSLRQQGCDAVCVPSYEALSYQTLVSRTDVCIAISQSGETADTNEVVEWMEEKGVKIASLVNMPGSTLTNLSQWPFMLQVGPEIAVASTKALTGQMVWGIVLGQLLGGKKLPALKNELRLYQQQLQAWLSDQSILQQLHQLAKDLLGHQHLYILGRGQLYPAALEFALKLKEISYIHAEGFSGGELKHGVIALVEEGTPVICLVADDEQQADMLSAAAEVKARKANVIGISTVANELFSSHITIPNSKLFAPISAIIPAQLLTYFLAIEKNLDPDKPRNLAKSVTVK